MKIFLSVFVPLWLIFPVYPGWDMLRINYIKSLNVQCCNNLAKFSYNIEELIFKLTIIFGYQSIYPNNYSTIQPFNQFTDT